jgi:hypothetical protein
MRVRIVSGTRTSALLPIPAEDRGIREDAVLTVYVSVFAPVACSRRNNHRRWPIHNQCALAEMG